MQINMEIDDSAVRMIKRLQEASGGTFGDVILDALRLYDWARQQYGEGYSVGSIINGRGIKEVDLPLSRYPITKKRTLADRAKATPKR
ncbi:MAG TPA: hypothetical protein VN937_08880 [Blastocatellia bacterium]|nr:hypothetical protein [Blastocatellia bacterium]